MTKSTDNLFHGKADKPTIETKTAIIDDYRSISYEEMSHTNEYRDDPTSLFINIQDGGDGASFFFRDAHEIRTFLTRVLDQVNLWIDEPTRAEKLRAEIYAFDKLCKEKEHTDTCAAWELLNLAARLL